MADTLTLYKLIVLKMLDEADAPLTGAQITDFILEKEYTNYFTLQQVLSEMSETGLVTVASTRNSSLYRITDSGRHTLKYFGDKVSDTSAVRSPLSCRSTRSRSAMHFPISPIIFHPTTAVIWYVVRYGNTIPH